MFENKIITSKGNKETAYHTNTITASKDDDITHKSVEQLWKHENFMNQPRDHNVSEWNLLLEETTSQSADGRWKIRIPMFWKKKMQAASKRLSISRTKIEVISRKKN